MFNKQTVECKVQDKKILIETGVLARQADGAVVVSCGDNRVLVTCVSSRRDSTLDFFPLTVEYQEKFYSVGRVPGGFFKREGRPSGEATLSARLIDRTIRPLFPEGYRRDTQVVVTVLSSDGGYPLEILGGIGASACLHISDIPFAGPVGFVQTSLDKDDNYAFNLDLTESQEARMNIIVGGTAQGLLMVEGSANFVSEKQALEGLKASHKSLLPVLKAQEELRKKAGNKTKREFVVEKPEASLQKQVKDIVNADLDKALAIPTKMERYRAYDELKKKLKEAFQQEELADKEKDAVSCFENLKYEKARAMILDTSRRIDGRALDDIRPIACEVGLLPRVHGSALFTRGETQVLGMVTLGSGDDEKIVDGLLQNYKKRFYLHYNFPPYSVGETGRFGGGSRREIGHGFLAERALKACLPDHDNFPYTVCIVSEVLESNGSSSMGTVCSGMMALLQAGVPVKQNIAGIAMGLIKGKDQVRILSDILGDEDHLGDMDFKVAGSKDGITALQMDIKIDSISFDVIEQALSQAKKGRLHILGEMEKVIVKPEGDLSAHAPRIEVIKIQPEKIREIIGSGGKTINKITEETQVKINIEDDGTLFICAPAKENLEKARSIIEGICEDPEEGKIYDGTVTGIKEFGAFVEILPNTSGLLHISQISKERINEVSDVLKLGDKVRVKVLQVEGNGRIKLSVKAVKEDES